MDYKLSTVLYGHVLDVRGLATTNEGFIVSVSRDKTVKLWKPNSENNGYTEVQTFKRHTNYVVCSTVLKNSKVLPDGLILTGSNDKLICGFTSKVPEVILIEASHKDTVCKLNPGILPDTFVSSSWDATARLWQITVNPDQSLKTELIAICNGHTAAVWSAIQLSTNQIVTCSADKTILVHVIIPGKPDKSTAIIKKLTGHTDCVRDLGELTNNEFLSCSNDATVKRWNVLSGDCLETFHGHPSYIYSLCVLRGTDITNSMVVTGGEDRYVNVWQSSTQQVILQPAQSIWAVTVLPNSDIVVGCSDGLIRIFSTDPRRQTSKEAQAAFQEQVDHVNQEAQKEIGGIKVDSLPGPEILYKSGKSDGQIIMVNENGKPICYKWLSKESKWDKIGDVLSGSNPSKNMHDGKEYDYVWNVDIEEGSTPLQLPFNKNQDPWLVAQQFIHKNNLPQSYLETVANFIVTNAKISSETKNPPVNQEYIDPYTGGARYVPKSINTNQTSSKHSECFPQSDYLKFDQANTATILSKLEEFNNKPGLFYKLNKSQIESLLKLFELDTIPDQEIVNVLISLLDWPNEIVFPVLDITRLAIRNKHITDVLCSDGIIMSKLLPLIYNIEKPVNQMLAVRCLCNLMHHEKGEMLVVKYYEEILTFIQKLKIENFSLRHLQTAIATFLINLSVMIKQSEDAIAIQNVSNTVNALCPKMTEPEAMYRCFVAIGTLLCLKNPPILTEQIRDYIELMASNSEPSKVLNCCKQIMSFLENKS